MTCSAATPKLTEEEIEERLTRLAGWSRAENWIEKKYEFKNFLRAMDYELGTTNFFFEGDQMGLISDADRETIRTHFDESLTGEVEIVMFTERESPIIIPGKQPCEMCAQTEELLEEVVSLSDKLKLTVLEISSAKEQAFALGIHRVPAFVFEGAARGQVRFFGIPSGYEFSALIADLVDVSTGTTDLSEETREYLSALTEDVNIKVFTTPT